TPESDERQIRDAVAAYDSAVRRMDSDAIAAMYTADGEMWNAGQRICEGPDAIRAFLKSFEGHVKVETHETTIESVELAGDRAVVVATYHQRSRLLDGASDVAEVRGRIRFEWVRTDATHWRLKRAETM